METEIFKVGTDWSGTNQKEKWPKIIMERLCHSKHTQLRENLAIKNLKIQMVRILN